MSFSTSGSSFQFLVFLITLWGFSPSSLMLKLLSVLPPTSLAAYGTVRIDDIGLAPAGMTMLWAPPVMLFGVMRPREAWYVAGFDRYLPELLYLLFAVYDCFVSRTGLGAYSLLIELELEFGPLSLSVFMPCFTLRLYFSLKLAWAWLIFVTFSYRPCFVSSGGFWDFAAEVSAIMVFSFELCLWFCSCFLYWFIFSLRMRWPLKSGDWGVSICFVGWTKVFELKLMVPVSEYEFGCELSTFLWFYFSNILELATLISWSCAALSCFSILLAPALLPVDYGFGACADDLVTSCFSGCFPRKSASKSLSFWFWPFF